MASNPYIGEENGKYRRTRAAAYSGSSDTPGGAGVGALTGTAEGANAGEGAGESSRIRAGEIIAYRAWHIYEPKMELMSTYAPVTWQRGPMPRASYMGFEEPLDWEAHHAGDWEAHHAGYYSFKTPKQCLVEFGNEHYVCGSIAIWGTVIEHTLGYRSEFAEIISIDSVPLDCHRRGWRGLIDKLNWRYKNPVLRALRKKYGVADDND